MQPTPPPPDDGLVDPILDIPLTYAGPHLAEVLDEDDPTADLEAIVEDLEEPEAAYLVLLAGLDEEAHGHLIDALTDAHRDRVGTWLTTELPAAQTAIVDSAVTGIHDV